MPPSRWPNARAYQHDRGCRALLLLCLTLCLAFPLLELFRNNPQINPGPCLPIGKPRFCDIPALSELAGKSPGPIRNKQSHLGFNNMVRKWCDFKVFISPGMHFPKQELADTGRASAGKTRSGLGGPEKNLPRCPEPPIDFNCWLAQTGRIIVPSVNVPLEMTLHS